MKQTTSTIRKDVVNNAFEDWRLNMSVGMTPKVAREMMEHDYEYFTEHEQSFLSSIMMRELEARFERR